MVLRLTPRTHREREQMERKARASLKVALAGILRAQGFTGVELAPVPEFYEDIFGDEEEDEIVLSKDPLEQAHKSNHHHPHETNGGVESMEGVDEVAGSKERGEEAGAHEGAGAPGGGCSDDDDGASLVVSNPLDVLVGIVEEFIMKCGNRSHVLHELAGRTAANSLDFWKALKKTGVDYDELLDYGRKANALRAKHPEMTFLVRDSGETESMCEIPQDVPSLIKAAEAVHGQGAGVAESVVAMPDYIPETLPVFPDPHTYKRTPIYPKRLSSFVEWRKARARQRELARINLANLSIKYGKSLPAIQQPVALVLHPGHVVPYMKVPEVLAFPRPEKNYWDYLIANIDPEEEQRRVERAREIENMAIDELSADIAKAKMSISVVIKFPDSPAVATTAAAAPPSQPDDADH